MNQKGILIVLFFFCTIKSFSQVHHKLTLESAVKTYHEAIESATDKSAVTLDYIGKWKKSDFVNEQDYFDFIVFCEEDLKIHKGSRDIKACFAVGKILYYHGKRHDAYGYLYRVCMMLKENEKYDDAFLMDFYESMGLSYFYFRRYDKAKTNFFKALEFDNIPVRSQININNTIGLIYRDQGEVELSRKYFEKALDIAKRNGNVDWVGVISGNLGVYYSLKKEYPKAKQLAETDFDISLKTQQWGSALNALSLLIDIDIAQNNLDAAVEKMGKASLLLKMDETASGKWTFYHTLTNLLEKKGDYKGALESNKKSVAYRDTMVREVNLENFNNTEFQINFERKQAEISVLNEKKKKDDLKIYGLIIFAILLIGSSIIIIRQIQKRRTKDKEILLLQKLSIEGELLNSEKEMRSVVSKMIEKNELIDQLKEEIESMHSNQDDKTREEKEKLLDRLQSFTLLTEEDWQEFKRIFEKLNPDFFDYFQKHFPEVTAAEIRLAALIKLNLSNLEMARTLGISPDSVRKTNLRLRKKVAIEHQEDLVVFVKNI